MPGQIVTTSLKDASLALSPAQPTAVYETFWRFAAERQEVFFRRIEGKPPPWTSDPIIRQHRFTNAYRASDRVSQYLMRHVIYDGEQSTEEVFFRTILFRLFNRIETWQRLNSALPELTYESYTFGDYDRVLLAALQEGSPIYSAAYIMPTGKSMFGYPRKHRNHLRLLEMMMEDELPARLAESTTMAHAFELLRSYPMVGNFLAYQFVTDLNYSNLTDFSEMEFTVPGPGALDGIHKCFTDLGGLSEADIIEFVAAIQQQEFTRLGLTFHRLGDRPLQLIDIQNLFCEVSKYARLRHPDIRGINDRKRIKQTFRPSDKPLTYWYPPKWGINHLFQDEDTIKADEYSNS